MADDKIVKIYDISTIGADDTLKDLEKINKQFIDIKKNKLSLNGLKASIEDPEELKKIDKELTDLLLTEKKLQTELKQKQIQMKEYQLLAAKEREEKKKQAAGNTALAGSYNDINKKYKDLLATAKNGINLLNPQEVEAAQTELRKYKDLLDNFNRGLTKDGTLVGEYTTGILQAFKKSGLDDVINDQLTKAKQNVTDLDAEFEQLKQELSNIHVTGQGSLQAVEQQLLDNRKAAQGFQEQIDRVEQELKSMNSTGSSIGHSIGLQFKSLKQDMAGFVLGFVGFQAALSGIQQFGSGAIEEIEQAETAVARFKGRLKNLGRENELDGINETIDGLVSRFKSLDNDDLTNAAEQLVTYGKVTEAQIRQLLPIIVDFAANSRISVQEATSAVVKGLEGNGKALKEYGIDMKDAENQTEAFALITEILGTKVQGSAEIFASTATGALAANKQALKDQQEILGEQLLPLYVKFTSLLSTLAGIVLAIPFGFWVGGITAVTLALALYRAEQVRSYIATQIATKEGLIYRAWTIAQTLATRAQALATRMATWELTLFNTAIKISPLGWMLTILALLVPALIGMAKAFGANNEAMGRMAKSMEDLNEATETGIRNAANEISTLDRLYAKTQDTTASIKDRKAAVDELQRLYPSYFGNLKDEIILNGKATDQYNSLRDAILASAKARAIEAKLQERAGDRLVEEERLLKNQKEALDELNKNRGKEIRIESGSYSEHDHRVDIISPEEADRLRQKRKDIADKELQDFRDKAKKADDILSGSLEDYQKQAKALEDAREKARQEALKNLNNYTNKVDKAKDDHDKKVNRVDDLKKEYDAEKSTLEANYKDHLITESKYYDELILLADRYRFTKLKAIDKLNNDELLSQRNFNADLADAKADANQKLFDIDLKYVQQKKQAIENELKGQLNGISSDASLSDVERVQKQIEIDNKLLELQVKYNQDIDSLEKKYTYSSTDNANERAAALKALQLQLNQDLVELQKTQFDQLQENEKTAIDRIKNNITTRALGIYSNKGLSPGQKDKKLKQLEKDGAKELESERLSQIDTELQAYQSMLDSKAISQAEFNKQSQELENERLGILRGAAERELEDDKRKWAEKEKLFQAGFQIAEKFMNAYMQKLNMQVEAEYNSTRAQLDSDKEKRLQLAQSQAEKEAIEEEFRAKEKEAERQRNIERQEVAKKQLALEFAVASIKAISTSSNIYEGLAKEAIVLAEYLAALSLLNAQQFAFSGKVQPYNLTAGLIKNNPNIAPTANGDNVIAYVKPGEVILNKQHQAMLGGDRTFASIGVPGFKSYGSSVQPPVFRSYIATNGSSSQNGSNDIAEMKQMVLGLMVAIESESYKPVLLDPNAVSSYQYDQAKKVNLATV